MNLKQIKDSTGFNIKTPTNDIDFLNDPYYQRHSNADKIENAAQLAEGVLGPGNVTYTDDQGIYINRPITKEEGQYLQEVLRVPVSPELYNFKGYIQIVDSELKPGDLYNDGEYSGKVLQVDNDSVTIESTDDNGDVVNITIEKDKVGDSTSSAQRLITEANINDLFDYGYTEVLIPRGSEVSAADIEDALDTEFAIRLAEDETIPEFEVELDDNICRISIKSF